MKPENILFTDKTSKQVKIIDFGASCEDFKTGFFYVQSRYYRAPEVVLGCEYDHAVDIWSMGCIIYELITGQPLFPAQNENELLEYFILTIGEIPPCMLQIGKKYKQFFSKPGGSMNDLIRSRKVMNEQLPVPGKQSVRKMLARYNISDECISFIEKCLALHPEERVKPQAALHHRWIIEI
jgi:dual specificity tyrosine-phosphorylation-regulated kinase 2/3/4